MSKQKDRLVDIRRGYDLHGELPDTDDCMWMIAHIESLRARVAELEAAVKDSLTTAAVPDGYRLQPLSEYEAMCAVLSAQPAADDVLREVMGLVKQYGDERATEAYHGAFHCRKRPADVLKSIEEMLAATKNSCQQKPTIHASYECPHCGAVGSHEQDSCNLLDANSSQRQGGA